MPPTSISVHADTQQYRTQAGITAREVWQALETHQLLPYYQPKVSLRDMTLVGVEALLRWPSRRHGLVCAREMLPFLQERALSEAVTRTIIETALPECHKWKAAGLKLRLAINLPAQLLYDERLVDGITQEVGRHGLAPDDLIVEVPESAFSTEMMDRLDLLVQVRVRGFGLAVDDFGTGHCSRQQIERIPASEMKVDRCLLVEGVRHEHGHRQLCAAIALAHELNLDCVAEGVETFDEWKLAHAVSCDFAQGKFIAPPMPGDELLGWCGQWTAGTHADIQIGD